jgi:branched-subunit amino acid aminotransferase/4-amino-4-deoxychorismate lyase
MVIWLNGSFVEGSQAAVSALDAGVQHGVGLFETMQARNGRVFRLQDHLERMAESAAELELVEKLRVEPLAEAVVAVMQRWGRPEARIRLTLTGGVVNMLREAREGRPVQVEPTLLIVASPPTPFPDELFERGVGVMVADDRVSPLDRFGGHKTLWYWPRLAALRTAAQSGASEALWFDVTNRLACGCTSNVFLVKGDRLLTPLARGEEPRGGLRSPVLPGVARRTLMGLASACGLRTDRCSLTVDDVLGADEVFLSNVSWGVLPVIRMERSTIGSGGVGPATRSLRQAWLQAVDGHTRG